MKDQQLSLPGGVGLSRNTTTGVLRFSLPNNHGSLLAVVDQTGAKQGATYKWDPDGMPIGGTTQPDLLNGNLENGWRAQHSRPVDTADPAMPVIEMGEEVLLGLGPVTVGQGTTTSRDETGYREGDWEIAYGDGTSAFFGIIKTIGGACGFL